MLHAPCAAKIRKNIYTAFICQVKKYVSAWSGECYFLWFVHKKMSKSSNDTDYFAKFAPSVVQTTSSFPASLLDSCYMKICNTQYMIQLMFVLFLSLLISCSEERRNTETDKAYALLEEVWNNNSRGYKLAALTLADSALAMKCADTTRCWLMCEKTVALLDIGRTSDAIGAGREALSFAEAIGDAEAIMNLHGTLGIAYRREGKLDSAVYEYRKGIEQALREQNPEYEIYLDNCISVLYSEYNHFDEALEYASKAEQTAIATNDTIERLSARANIGGVYLRQKQYRKALDVMLPLWDDVLRTDYSPLTLKYLSIILKSYAVLDDVTALRTFMPYAEKAIGNVSSMSAGTLGILETKAYMLGKEGRFKEQLALIDSLSATSHLMPGERLMSEKAKCLAAMGHYADAFDLMSRAYAMLDSVKQSDIERSMGEFTMRYKTLEKEVALEQMMREQAETDKLIFGFVAIVMLLVAMVCILLYWRRLSAQKAELQERRNYIQGMENERERIARELHDGVCNDILAATMLLSTDSKRGMGLLKNIWKDVRHLSHALMPPRFADVTLVDAVRSYVAMITSDGKCSIEMSADDSCDWHLLPQQVAYETYRIIQEAVGNAVRYGGDAPSVKVSLTCNSGVVVASVVNTTANAPFCEQSLTGIGVETMRKRANTIGAELTTSEKDGEYVVRMTFKMRA